MPDQAYAIYRSTETVSRYYNGTGYVVRHDMFPHTTWPARTDGQASRAVTRQGHAIYTGMRQGLGDAGGFTVRLYSRPDTQPFYIPA